MRVSNLIIPQGNRNVNLAGNFYQECSIVVEDLFLFFLSPPPFHMLNMNELFGVSHHKISQHEEKKEINVIFISGKNAKELTQGLSW